MRLILTDLPTPRRLRFHPVSLSRPIWELRCGLTTLIEKLIARAPGTEVACFVPPYMADAYRATTERPVNDPAALAGDDLLVVAAHVKASAIDGKPSGSSRVITDTEGEVLWAWIVKEDLAKLDARSIDALLESAKRGLPVADAEVPTWGYLWDLVLANPAEIVADFKADGRRGIEGHVEQPCTIRGSVDDVYVAPDAVVHPMVVLDATEGPIHIDRDAVIHPFTRIEGPCSIGRGSILLGAKCRAGNSIGPVCRVGGEVEGSILQGYSNKYHDGFLGHAYVGQWVNLGAGTTNSDLRNDYGDVSVVLDGRHPIITGSPKVGALIGDHVKTSIGTLLNTGTYVGAMALVVATGGLLPKFIPSFTWLVGGRVSMGFGKQRLYETAKTAMRRRGCTWTEADEAMWDDVFRMTEPAREEALRRACRMSAKSTPSE